MAGSLSSLTVQDPAAGALFAAVRWIEAVLLGPLATTFATLAIAWLGFAMLTGRTDWRRGLTVLLGCFILFGAPVIARGLAGLAGVGGGSVVAPIEASMPQVPPQPEVPNLVDPYAGAAVPGVE